VTFRLERDGIAPLVLSPDNGWHVRAADFGFPNVRAVVDGRPQADGTDDRTRHFGARVVSLDLLGRGQRQQRIDQLSPFLVPNRRSYLYFPVGNFERRILLRGRDRSAVYDRNTGKQAIFVQWDAPNGTMETAVEQTATAFASDPVEPGFTFDLTFPLLFPNATPVGTTIVTTVGNALCPPILQLYGPCVNPRIENVNDLDELGAAKRLQFNITIAQGDFLEVDVRERTVNLNGNPAQNRYSTLDFAASRWWTLQPGPNAIRYFPQSYSGDARAVVAFRCQFL
jgi:hypothetical protein